MTELPKVLSPHKVQYVPEKVVEKLLVFYSNLEKRKVHQFQTTKGESECFHDRYYKMEDGDENILNSFVDAHEWLSKMGMEVMDVVEVESLDTWKWFLETLKADLNIDNTYPWKIMTDKQKVSLCAFFMYHAISVALILLYVAEFLCAFFNFSGLDTGCEESLPRL